MSPPLLIRLLAAYAILLAAAFAGLWLYLGVDAEATVARARIYSAWRGGQRVARAVVGPDDAAPALACEGACTRAVDAVVAEGPILVARPLIIALSLVPGRDGLKATLGDRTAWLTPDDLLACGAATGHNPFGEANVKLGIGPVENALRALAAELRTTPERVLAEANLRRFSVRPAPDDERAPLGVPLPDDALTPDRMRRAVQDAADYLIRHQREDGGFEYWIDAVSGRRERGYSWPRHGGAASFLAEAAAYTKDPATAHAAVKAARHMLDKATLRCGDRPCVGSGAVVDVGSTAMAVSTYAELVQSGLDLGLRDAIPPLTDFLRSQQRPDGEFMHFYDRHAPGARDEQTQYYTGEATLALARAYAVTRNPADLAAARRALAYMIGPRWRFFGDVYFYGNEHWTCQALEALQAYGPTGDVLQDDALQDDALRFCLKYNTFGRFIQRDHGGYNLHPLHLTRVSDTGSRTEAAAATLSAARAAGLDAATLAPLEGQVRRAIRFLIGFQFDPGPAHLMHDPAEMRGGFPGSAVDMAVRIDLAQHAGAGILRYLRYLEQPPR